MSFPDLLPPLVAHLAAVTSVHVGTRVPDPAPVRWVQVRRVGGTAVVPVRDQPRIDVWAYAATEHESMGLANLVRGAVWALAGTTLAGVGIYGVAEFMGPRLDDDPIRGTTARGRRTWSTYEITIRAESAVPFRPA